MELYFFYAFAALLMWSAFKVIRVENAVHAVLYLVVVFCTHSALLILLSIEFLSLLLLVIYIGAIAILFLFVVMMITLKEKPTDIAAQDLPIGLFIGSFFFLVIFYAIHQEIVAIPYPKFNILNKNTFVGIHLSDQSRMLYGEFHLLYPHQVEKVDLIVSMSKDIEKFGTILYQNFYFSVLIAGVILLVALLGAVTLASELGKKRQKRQQIYQQLSRQMKNAVLRIKSEKP